MILPGEKRYIVMKDRVITLTANAKSHFEDEFGVVYAIRDSTASIDPSDNCGIFPFSLPSWHIFRELNEKCRVHDYIYECPYFQYYHTRSEAEQILENLIKQDDNFFFLAKPFRWLASLFGGRAWENDKTRDL